MKKPNIIFYFSDQQRWDTCGCYGQKLPVTPNLDKLAAEGTKFENAYTCQPVCGPARACLQSGVYATQIGCHRNGIALPQDIPTLADCFNNAGYETAYVGKWHLATNRTSYEEPHNNANHFETVAIPKKYRGGYKDYWMAADVLEFTSHGYNGYVFDKDNNRHDFIGYRADCINNYAIDYLHHKTSDKPFFMFVSQIEPHHQNDHSAFEGPDGSKQKFKDFEVPLDLVGTKGNWRESYPDYLGQCNSLDYNVGKLVDTLKAMGEWENTILFYSSDHGSHFCTRNSEYKRSCHDGSTHVPMIAVGGAFNTGKTVHEMVSLIDIPTTLLDCAGIEKPSHFEGNSLKALVSGNNEKSWPEEIFMQISESQVGRAIRTHKWKYSIRANKDSWIDSGSDLYYEDFLYDLENDRGERVNLVAEDKYAEIRKQLSEIIARKIFEVEKIKPLILPYSDMPKEES